MPSTSDAPTPDKTPTVRGGATDCDLWAWKPSLRDLSPHLAESWRAWLRVEEPARPGVRIALPESPYFVAGGALTAAATPEEAEQRLRSHLDATNTGLAVLNPGAASSVSGLASGLLGDAVARAVNEWTAERWLALDDRLWGSIVVSAREPERAAAEIHRAGAEPRMAQVLFAYPQELLGHRSLVPVYEAAIELDLPVMLQAGGDFSGANPGVTRLGTPGGSRLEALLAWEYGAQPHLVNLLLSGIFDRLPELRVVLSGFGVGWLPPLLWRLDHEFHEGRLELPATLTRLPSEIAAEHVRVAVSPRDLADAGEPDALQALLGSVGGGRLLLPGSGPRRELDTGTAALPPAWTGLGKNGARAFYPRCAP